MSSSNGKQNNGPARLRYWRKHDKPTRKIDKLPGMQKRIRHDEYTLIQQIADFGSQSDVTVLKMRPADLQRNRAFVEHQQKLDGQIERLARTVFGSAHTHDQVTSRRVDGVYAMATGSTRIPHRAELDGLRSAFKTLDVRHYPPCSKVQRCSLYDKHVGPCKERD